MQRFLLAIVLLVAPLEAGAWELRTRTDAMTDVQTKEVCGTDSSKNEICLRLVGESLFVAISLADESTGVFAADRLPMLRVDSNRARDYDGLLKLQRELGHEASLPKQIEARWLEFRAQTPSHEGGELNRSNPKGLWYQLMNGKVLKIRIFLYGGYQADSTVALTGIGDLLPKL